MVSPFGRGTFLLIVENACTHKIYHFRGAWVAPSDKRPTSAQVMMSRFVGSSPASGSVLTARSLELLWILCLPLSVPLSRSCSVSKVNIKKKKKIYHFNCSNMHNSGVVSTFPMLCNHHLIPERFHPPKQTMNAAPGTGDPRAPHPHLNPGTTSLLSVPETDLVGTSRTESCSPWPSVQLPSLSDRLPGLSTL